MLRCRCRRTPAAGTASRRATSEQAAQTASCQMNRVPGRCQSADLNASETSCFIKKLLSPALLLRPLHLLHLTRAAAPAKPVALRFVFAYDLIHFP